MGWMPCLRCDQRFTGQAINVYLTVYWGDEREAYRYPVCEPCVEHLVAEWQDRALRRNEDGDWEYLGPGAERSRVSAGLQERPQAPGRPKKGPRAAQASQGRPRPSQRGKSLDIEEDGEIPF